MQKMPNIIKALLLLAPFSFLYSPQAPVFGFFFRHEFLFQILVLIATALFFVDRFFGREKGSGRLRFTWGDIALVAFLVAHALATLFAYDSLRSFFGTWQRMTGLVSMLHLGLYYLLARIYFQKRDVPVILRSYSVLMIALSFYVMLQVIGFFGDAAQWNGRPPGSFTNTAILAGFLLVGVFLSLFGALYEPQVTEKQKRGRIVVDLSGWGMLHATAMFFAFIAMALTLTRAALLGAAFGLLVLVIFGAFSKRVPGMMKRISQVLGVLGIVLVILLGVQIAFAPVSTDNALVQRITNPELLYSGIRNRVFSWEAAWDSFVDRPLLGWGPENFQTGFDLHADTALFHDIDLAEGWFDKSHNIFLETMATAGALGLAAQLFLLAVLFFAAWRAFRDEPAYFIFWGLLVAYIVNGIFIFDSFEQFSALLLALALLAILQREHVFSVDVPELSLVARGVVAAMGIGAMSYSLIAHNMMPAWAEAHYYRGWQAANDLAVEESVEQYQKAFSLDQPYRTDEWERFAQFIIDNRQEMRRLSPQLFSELGFLAFDSFDDMYAKRMASARAYYMAARVGNFIFADLSPEKRDFIMEYLVRARDMAPSNPDVRYEMATYYQKSGDVERAAEILEEVKGLDEQLVLTNMSLGLAYALDGDFASAIREFEQVFELGYTGWKDNPNYVNIMHQVYTHKNFIETYPNRLPEIFEAKIRWDSENVQLYIELAAAYKEVGEYGRAIEAAKKAVELNPAVAPAAEAFIREIEQLQAP